MSIHERVRSAVPLLGAFASMVVLAFVPTGADAQTYSATLEPFTFEALPFSNGETEVTHTLQGTGYAPYYIDVTLPFAVEFFGEAYNQISVLGNGTVAFGTSFAPFTSSTTTGNIDRRTIPSETGTRHNFIAVWQDQQVCSNSPGGPLKSQVVGSAGSRHFVIQWTGCRRYAGSTGEKYTAQLWLSEATSAIEVRYGALDTPTAGNFTWSASIGIENSDGTDGTPGLSLAGTVCNPNCVAADFPSNHRIIYSSEPKATIDSVSVNPSPVILGNSMAVSAWLTNERSRPLDNVSMRYWVGRSPSITEAQDVGMVTGVTLPGAGTIDFPFVVETTGWAAGQYYVIAELDPFGMHFPLDEPRQVYAAGPIEVKNPTTSVQVVGGSVQAPGWLAAEATFDVSFDVENRDLLDAQDAMYSVVLSTDTVLDDADAVLGVGYFSLASSARTSITKTVALPPGLADGRYWIGVWVDPYGELPQTDRTGTRRIATSQTTVGLELEIVTTEVPGGRVGNAYSVDLRARGGDGTYSWTVASGSLPPGLSIGKVSGVDRISGIPSADGTFAFTLQAASDRFTDSASYSIEILPSLVPLEITTTELPGATLGNGYTAQLAARGGTPPYTWSFDGIAPEGLVMAPTGRFGGTPLEEGRQVMFVAVQDADGVRATMPLSLEVEVAPLACADVTNLAPVTVGDDFHPVTFRATGGKAPYTWSSVSGAVPGLTLSAEGRIDGSPTEAGTFDWKVGVVDALSNAASCKVRLEVTEQPKPVELQVATDLLPRVRVLDSYEVQL
ncbi:MAG TPA: Ig domain-containing protein, partial [Vulgatibacter sp.]